jgi:hypothetical protein
VLELSDAAGADEVAGEAEADVAALLGAGLQDSVVLLLDREQPLALVDRERQRLLAVNVLAGLHGGHGDQRVPVVDGGADDHVEVLLLDELAEVGVGLGLGVLLLGLGEVLLIHVAHRQHAAETLGVLGVSPAHAAAADQA